MAVTILSTASGLSRCANAAVWFGVLGIGDTLQTWQCEPGAGKHTRPGHGAEGRGKVKGPWGRAQVCWRNCCLPLALLGAVNRGGQGQSGGMYAACKEGPRESTKSRSSYRRG